MKNQNSVFIAIAVAVALGFALAPVTKGTPVPGGGPNPIASTARPVNSAESMGSEEVGVPVISIHSTGNILLGKTGAFVLDMKPALMFGATYVNFTVSGTAVAGVDYVALASPAFIGQSGYGTILIQSLPDPRAGFSNQAYSVVVTLQPGVGYALGESKSATIWIKPSPASGGAPPPTK